MHIKRWRIYGRVQGVWYRQSACEKASVLNLGGWVRNCDDGSVELQVCGAEAAVAQMRLWCEQGPTLARVTHIIDVQVDSQCQGESFSIIK